MSQSKKFCLQCWLWRKSEMKKCLLVLLILGVVTISACTMDMYDELPMVVQDISICNELNEVEESMSGRINSLNLESGEMSVGVFAVFGYDDIYSMAESSDIIIRVKVLNERIELVNINLTLEEVKEDRVAEYEAGLISRDELEQALIFSDNNMNLYEPWYEYVIFYQVEILEVFQSDYDVGDIIDVFVIMGWDEKGNPCLEHSSRYDVGGELILFLRVSHNQRLRYFLTNLDQALYEIPVGLVDEEMILEPPKEFRIDLFEDLPLDGNIAGNYDNLPEPFDVNLGILREIAEENGLLEEDNGVE